MRDDANDIVTRLRLRPTILRKNQFGDMETDRAATALFDDCHALMREAADEIEKLRGRLLGEENAYDIMRIERENMEKDQNNLSLAVEDIMMRNQKLTLENELLRRERDEARRLYCEEWAFTIELERGEASDPRDLANEKKWDCYKEIHNEE